MKLQFLGAAGTVTGSKYLLTINQHKILIDCGLYQGIKNYRLRNWKPLPVDPASLDAVILTHAHIDHSGYLPLLMKNGFNGPVYSSRATYDLCRVLLPDSGFLHEEDARFANKHHFSKHKQAEPLYTQEDALASLKLFQPIEFNETLTIRGGIQVTLRPVGHILGAASAEIRSPGSGSAATKSIIFSGDVGRQQDLMMYPPSPLPACDYLVVESTYGNRCHPPVDPLAVLAGLVNNTIKRGGSLLLPAFAVGRAQLILLMLHQLKTQERIANIPVYLNSPMAIKATEIYAKHHQLHKLTHEQCEAIDDGTHYVRTMEESIALNNRQYPGIIISASGMASGGRVVHHLKAMVADHHHCIAFLGFQAPGTRGDAMIHGASQIKIHGQYLPVKAEVVVLENLSAHGDYQDIITWLKQSPAQPKQVFVTHGEPLAADSMRCHLRDQLGWPARVPEYLEQVTL